MSALNHLRIEEMMAKAAIVLTIVGVVCFYSWLYMWHKSNRDECEAAGGTYVRTGHGRKCIEAVDIHP